MLGGQIVIGSAMIAVTVVVHIAGMIGLIAFFKAWGGPVAEDRSYRAMTRVLVVTIVGIFFVHTLEIWLWAVLYIWLGEFTSFEPALYFSTVTFTTLGYGDITLQERWRLLSSFEAANGIILFGVSTAFVFAVMRKMFEATAIIKTEKG